MPRLLATVALFCLLVGCGTESAADPSADSAARAGEAAVTAGSVAAVATAGNSAGAASVVPSNAGSAGLDRASSGHSGQNAAGSFAGQPAAGSGGAGTAGGPAQQLGPLTLYIAGDSTVSTYKDTASDKDQAGWGQMLQERLNAEVTVDNRAIGGRTARRFIDDGRLDEIFAAIRKGDYLLVQFGTNDGNKSASYMLGNETIPYYLDPSTDFKTYLKRYIEGARSRGATPVLVTPPPRNSAYCTGGNGTGAHAQAMRELGKSEAVSVVDLNQKSVDYLKAICPEPSPPDFFLERSDGTVDGTHFQERGARALAGFVADGLREAGVGFVLKR